MILLDTVVLSELRKRNASPEVLAWVGRQRDDELFISVVSLGEIERGIEKKRTTDAAFADQLAQWLDELQRRYADRILPITPAIARRWGQLSARIGNDGVDLLIAATALCHGLKVGTRNVRHFEPAGVGVVNPWEEGYAE
jgi:hypothetical protein